MRHQFQQAFGTYPETTGLVVRTGETYVFDNPYHVGNSPLAALRGASEAEQQHCLSPDLEHMQETMLTWVHMCFGLKGAPLIWCRLGVAASRLIQGM